MKGIKKFLCAVLAAATVFSLNVSSLSMSALAFSSASVPCADAAADTAKPTVTTTLQDGAILKGSIRTFDLLAKNADGTKISASDIDVELNGSKIDATWDDSTKTSYKLILKVGTNTVTITAAGSDKAVTTVTYTLNHTAVNQGDVIGSVTVDVEAFTISNGYIVAPEQVPIKEGENGAQLLDSVLTQNGLKYKSTGSLTRSFYLSAILDDTKKLNITNPALPPILASSSSFQRLQFNDAHYKDGSLGEFDFDRGSGWMYCINGNFPNYGFADCYPCDGDVLRVQYTLAYGNDIGGGYALGDGAMSNYYGVANKDGLTALVAKVNSAANKNDMLADSSIKAAYDTAVSTLEGLGSDQNSVDSAFAVLNTSVANYKPANPTPVNPTPVNPTPVNPIDTTVTGTVGGDGSKDSANITPDFGDTTKYANVDINLGSASVTLSSTIINSAFGGATNATLSLSKCNTPDTVKNIADKALSGKNMTDISALDLDLTKSANGTTQSIHNLGGSSNVTITLTDAQTALIKDVSKAHLLYYDKDTGDFTDMNAAFNLSAKTVSFVTTHLSTYIIAEQEPDIAAGVSYQAHVQKLGWQNAVADGGTAGTTGKSLRLEALKLKLTGTLPAGASIIYQAHVQKLGWQNAVADGETVGTTGRNLRLEAVKITVNGLAGYEVKYRVHVKHLGWMPWQTTKNGTAIADSAVAGTTGRSLQIEAIEISVEKIPA